MAVVPPVEAAERLRLTEIFLSLQGEARSVGWPTVFVRLTGCPLRCQYCDTAYAFHGGQCFDQRFIFRIFFSFGRPELVVDQAKQRIEVGGLDKLLNKRTVIPQCLQQLLQVLFREKQ